MSDIPLEIATRLRPSLTRLYLLYFRQTENSQISMAQMSIMMNLADNGPMRISQIAQAEAIRMPTASNAVNQLEIMGLVTRIRDVSDRRGVRVDLTNKGRVQLEQIAEIRSRNLAEMIAGLSEEELTKVQEAVPLIELILRRYTEHIEGKVEEESK